MESRALKRQIALGALFVTIGVAGAWWWRAGARRGTPPPAPSESPSIRPIVPAGTRIVVEVLNATSVRGLGRRATLYLRDLGFDVVRFTGDSSRRDTTLVIDRSGHPEWAQLVSRALGGVSLETHRDSSRYVDVTVLIGSSWRPPAKALYP